MTPTYYRYPRNVPSLLPRTIYLVFLAIMLEVVAYASSGETEFLIDSQKNFVCHRSLWANQYAPEGMGCPEIGPSGKDLIPGAIFVPAPLQNSSVTFLNGFPVSRSAYLGAIRPGAHGIITTSAAGPSTKVSPVQTILTKV